jgi:hypothetical protein
MAATGGTMSNNETLAYYDAIGASSCKETLKKFHVVPVGKRRTEATFGTERSGGEVEATK